MQKLSVSFAEFYQIEIILLNHYISWLLQPKMKAQASDVKRYFF